MPPPIVPQIGLAALPTDKADGAKQHVKRGGMHKGRPRFQHPFITAASALAPTARTLHAAAPYCYSEASSIQVQSFEWNSRPAGGAPFLDARHAAAGQPPKEAAGPRLPLFCKAGLHAHAWKAGEEARE